MSELSEMQAARISALAAELAAERAAHAQTAAALAYGGERLVAVVREHGKGCKNHDDQMFWHYLAEKLAAELPGDTRETFQDAARNDPDMSPEQKAKWLGEFVDELKERGMLDEAAAALSDAPEPDALAERLAHNSGQETQRAAKLHGLLSDSRSYMRHQAHCDGTGPQGCICGYRTHFREVHAALALLPPGMLDEAGGE